MRERLRRWRKWYREYHCGQLLAGHLWVGPNGRCLYCHAERRMVR